MITLYTFGPYFGLPDASPFVIKAMLLLKFAGLPFVENRQGYKRAPKGKLPFIDDNGTIVPDSTFIRFHIEKKYGFDFDAGVEPEQRAAAWAIEKMCEEHLYFSLLRRAGAMMKALSCNGSPKGEKNCRITGAWETYPGRARCRSPTSRPSPPFWEKSLS